MNLFFCVSISRSKTFQVVEFFRNYDLFPPRGIEATPLIFALSLLSKQGDTSHFGHRKSESVGATGENIGRGGAGIHHFETRRTRRFARNSSPAKKEHKRKVRENDGGRRFSRERRGAAG